jgi:hypothetical protein
LYFVSLRAGSQKGEKSCTRPDLRRCKRHYQCTTENRSPSPTAGYVPNSTCSWQNYDWEKPEAGI